MRNIGPMTGSIRLSVWSLLMGMGSLTRPRILLPPARVRMEALRAVQRVRS
jgi:hypothetical protein